MQTLPRDVLESGIAHRAPQTNPRRAIQAQETQRRRPGGGVHGRDPIEIERERQAAAEIELITQVSGWFDQSKLDRAANARVLKYLTDRYAPERFIVEAPAANINGVAPSDGLKVVA